MVVDRRRDDAWVWVDHVVDGSMEEEGGTNEVADSVVQPVTSEAVLLVDKDQQE